MNKNNAVKYFYWGCATGVAIFVALVIYLWASALSLTDFIAETVGGLLLFGLPAILLIIGLLYLTKYHKVMHENTAATFIMVIVLAAATMLAMHMVMSMRLGIIKAIFEETAVRSHSDDEIQAVLMMRNEELRKRGFYILGSWDVHKKAPPSVSALYIWAPWRDYR